MWGTDVAGVSFSQIGDSSGYHTILDRPDRVAPANLQQTGDISLALARHFGDLDLTDLPESGGLVAFTVAPGQTVTYPAGVALPAGALVLLAALGLIVIGKRRGRLTITGLLLGIVTTLVAVAATAAAAVLVTSLMAPEVHYARNPSGAGWRMVALSAVTLTVVAGLFLGLVRLLRREHRVGGLLLGPVVVVAALAVLTGLSMPALSYVFVWPAFGGVVVAGWQVFGAERPANPWPGAAVLAVSGAMVAVVGVPLVYLLASAASIAAPMFAAVIAVFVALLGSLLIPHLRALAGRRHWAVPAVLVVVAVAGLAGVQLSSGFSTEQPRPDYIQYTLDADTGQATWLSTGTSPDEWTEQFFPDGYTTDRRAFSPGYFFGQEFDVIEAPAPAVSLEAPELTVLRDSTTDGVRTLELRLASPRGAPTAHLDLDLPGELVAATVGGQAVKVDEGSQRREFPVAAYNLGTNGIQITLSVRSTDPITGTLTDFSNGLPDLSDMNVTERPPEFMPAPFDFRDPTAVTRSIEL